MGDALTDSLQRYDPKSQELAYNNTTDRMKVELPAFGDPSSSGVISNPVDASVVKGAFMELSSYSSNTVWTPDAGKRFVLTDFIFNAVQHGTLKVYDGVSDNDNRIMEFCLASGVTIDHTFRKPYPSSAIDNSLTVDCMPGCSGYLTVLGYEI